MSSPLLSAVLRSSCWHCVSCAVVTGRVAPSPFVHVISDPWALQSSTLLTLCCTVRPSRPTHYNLYGMNSGRSRMSRAMPSSRFKCWTRMMGPRTITSASSRPAYMPVPRRRKSRVPFSREIEALSGSRSALSRKLDKAFAEPPCFQSPDRKYPFDGPFP